MSQRVSISIQDHIADVRLNRPEKINALDPEMWHAIVETGESLATRNDVRCVVLSGEGRGFCSGLDFPAFMPIFMGTSKKRFDAFARNAQSPANYAQKLAYVWKQLPMPVVAALHGATFGGGFQLAMAADIRVVAPNTRLSVMEIKWGLIPDMTISQTLRDLVAMDIAKELTFTGRIVESEESKRLGLVTHIYENPHTHAMKLAQDIAKKSPHAIRAAKQLFDQTWHASPQEGLLLEETLQRSILMGKNQLEAVKANFDKREPNFHDID